MTVKMIGIYNFKQIGYCNSKRLIHKNAFSMEADFRTVFVLLLFVDEKKYFIIWTRFKIDRWHRYPFATIHQSVPFLEYEAHNAEFIH